MQCDAMSSLFVFSGIDDLIHTRMRLAILTYLASVDDADFKSILEATGSSDGNVSVHLKKLEDAGYVAISKTFVKRRPHTRARITDAGRDALIAYIDQVDAVFSKVRNAVGGGT